MRYLVVMIPEGTNIEIKVPAQDNVKMPSTLVDLVSDDCLEQIQDLVKSVKNGDERPVIDVDLTAEVPAKQ